MADVRRRIRRQISDATEDSLQASESEESSEEYESLQASRKQRSDVPASNTSATMGRPKRVSGNVTNGTTSATISRSTSGTPDDRRQSIRLTVKAPPSKLREVMRVNEVDSLQDVLGGGMVVEGPRRSRTAVRTSGRQPDKPRYTEYGESDIEDEEEDDEEEEDEDEEDEDDVDEDERMIDSDGNGVEEQAGSDEEDDEDEDVEMEDEPSPPKRLAGQKPPKITLKTTSYANGRQLPNPTLVVTPAHVGPIQSVEDQEMEDDLGDDDEDEEGSSELSEEENTNLNVGGRDEGEELDDEEELNEDEELDSSDDETPGSGSATPDLTKMTKRQRGRPEDSTELMALDMAPQQRKFFTDQEKAMKKDEHARKRKELTKRKIQEEKAAALNRLLKPQASKARGAAPKPETLAAAAAAGSPYYEEEYQEKAHPLYTRWVSTKDGIKLGVPDEWLGKRVARVLGPPSNGALVQEL